MPALLPLTDEDLRLWRCCARRFWHHRQELPAQPPGAESADASAETPVVHGPSPDDALRASYPGAVLIAAPQTAADEARALQQTAEALAAPRMWRPGEAVLGACFASADGARVRIDVLQRGAHGLRLFKRRYATVADEADVDAAALWAHVAAHCGLRVQSVGLLLVDTGFVYPGHGCYAGLFREVDLGPMLGSRPVTAWLTAMRGAERAPRPPAEPGPHCLQAGGCNVAADCQPAPAPPTAVAGLEVVGRDLAAELRDEGHVDLLSVPPHRLAQPRHRRALQAIRQQAPVFEPELAPLMRGQPYPRRMLRIDTIGFAVPVWAGTQPYQVLPYQWVCDEVGADGGLQRHHFLADAQGDPRRRFARTLLDALGREGPVFAYNAGFERNRLRDLAHVCPDLADALQAVQTRIVDLFQIARANAYHPAQRGSWSFKSVCRAFAPGVGAGGAAEPRAPETGASAQTLFARALRPDVPPPEREALHARLVAQGQQEAAALRELVRVFEDGDTSPRP